MTFIASSTHKNAPYAVDVASLVDSIVSTSYRPLGHLSTLFSLYYTIYLALSFSLSLRVLYPYSGTGEGSSFEEQEW